MSEIRSPRETGSPVMESLGPVIAASRHVATNLERIVAHAGWLAYEELPFPDFGLPYAGPGGRDEAIDFAMTQICINTAFTDFATRRVFEVEEDGQRLSDALAMIACLKRAVDAGWPLLDGTGLARLTREDLREIFAGSIDLPMLDEKLAVLHEVGRVLAARYGGRFHHFLATCSHRLYDGGHGLVERLVAEFPRFDDVSPYHGHEVKFYKLAQLGFWMLHCGLRRHGGFRIDDLSSMTAFADYIVPVALRVMGILEYTPDLDRRIAAGDEIPRDSDEEIEIRAHTLHATALLTDEVNARRPADRRVVIPQIDARLWTAYHATHWPHHLTRTTMY
jgi:hypothetical protein